MVVVKSIRGDEGLASSPWVFCVGLFYRLFFSVIFLNPPETCGGAGGTGMIWD